MPPLVKDFMKVLIGSLATSLPRQDISLASYLNFATHLFCLLIFAEIYNPIISLLSHLFLFVCAHAGLILRLETESFGFLLSATCLVG